MLQWPLLESLRTASERAGVALPTAIDRALRVRAMAQQEATSPHGGLLDLNSKVAVRNRIVLLAVDQHNGNIGNMIGQAVGLGAGLSAFEVELLEEMRAAALPQIEDLVHEARPRFEALAAPLIEAAQTHNLDSRTTAEQVLDRADEGAAAAWRSLRSTTDALHPLMRWRKVLSEVLEVSPTPSDLQLRFYLTGGEMDYSVAFAAGEEWSYDGAYYGTSKTGGRLDLLAIARGGLTLNSPAEVEAKLEARSLALRVARVR